MDRHNDRQTLLLRRMYLPIADDPCHRFVATVPGPEAIPEETDVIDICDKESVEDGEVVRRRTVITIGRKMSHSEVLDRDRSGMKMTVPSGRIRVIVKTEEKSQPSTRKCSLKLGSFNPWRMIQQNQDRNEDPDSWISSGGSSGGWLETSSNIPDVIDDSDSGRMSRSFDSFNESFELNSIRIRQQDSFSPELQMDSDSGRNSESVTSFIDDIPLAKSSPSSPERRTRSLFNPFNNIQCGSADVKKEHHTRYVDWMQALEPKLPRVSFAIRKSRSSGIRKDADENEPLMDPSASQHSFSGLKSILKKPMATIRKKSGIHTLTSVNRNAEADPAIPWKSLHEDEPVRPPLFDQMNENHWKPKGELIPERPIPEVTEYFEPISDHSGEFSNRIKIEPPKSDDDETSVTNVINRFETLERRSSLPYLFHPDGEQQPEDCGLNFYCSGIPAGSVMSSAMPVEKAMSIIQQFFNDHSTPNVETIRPEALNGSDLKSDEIPELIENINNQMIHDIPLKETSFVPENQNKSAQPSGSVLRKSKIPIRIPTAIPQLQKSFVAPSVRAPYHRGLAKSSSSGILYVHNARTKSKSSVTLHPFVRSATTSSRSRIMSMRS